MQGTNTDASKKHLFQQMLFWEVGAFEICMVVFLLTTIFSALHYFNILRLDSAFPILSFLPRLEKTLQQDSVMVKKNPVNVVTNEKIKIQLIDYIKSVVKPAYISQKLHSAELAYDKRNFAYEIHWGKESQIPAGNAGIEFEQQTIKYVHVSLYIMTRPARQLR